MNKLLSDIFVIFVFIESYPQSFYSMELQQIHNKIHEIRGQKVMIDRDLAEVYGVETRVLNQAVKRNIDRFPTDFMFQLTDIEYEILISQNVTSS